MKRGIFFILLSLFCTFSAQAQLETKGTDFWLAFAKTYIYDQPDNLIFEIKIVADEAATGTIKYTSLSNITIPFTISAGGVFTHTLSLTERNAVYNATYGITISNKSIHIESDVPVSVYAINLVNHLAGDAIADATNVLPTSVLGTEYYHAGRISDDPAGTRNKFDQNLIIVTQNGTNIYQNGKEIGTNLSAGAVYYNQFAPNKDITGARITSNKPVAYFSAHNFCQISGGGDNFFQQLTPVNTWGKKFMVPVTSRGIELIRIVASQDNTTITQTGGTITTKYGGKNSLTLDAGQWVELEIKLSSNGCYIQSDKPVQVCSYMVGGAYPGAINTIGGDESICWVPPVEQRLNSVLISPFVMSNFNRHYALIVTPTATKNNTTVSIGGAPAVGLSGGTWYDNSDSGMSFYNVELSNSSVAYTYSNNSGVIVYAYGFGVAISYYYMAGSAARPLEVNCLEEGTLLYKQDFGGNDVNDPPFAKLPFSCGFTEVPFSATGPKGESYYNLVKNAHNVYPGEFWADNYDHTYPEDPDRGYMMVVHPVCSITPPPRTGQVVYGTHIGGLCDGVTLSFSAWLTDVNDKGESFGGKHPIVEMIVLDKITGDTLKSSGIIEVPHGKVWTRYSFDFELPQGVDSITFKILNKQPAFQGNDLGIDDIEIRLCTPPVLTTLPDVIEECKGSATTLYASYTDDGIFGNELSYRWERSLDGNINNPSGWLVVPGSQGSVPTGIVSSLFTMPLLKASDAGYYRFVVGKVSSINKWACRAASKVIELKVNALSSIGEIKIPAAICVNDTVVASAPFSVQGNSWLSSNPEVATIDAVTGKIIGIQDGRVMISCIVSDGICTDTLRTLLEVDFCLDCSEGGTVLYRQDFGGNSPSDPYTSPTGFSPENSDLLYSTVNIHQTHERGYYTLTKNPYYIYKEGFHSITDHTHPEDTTRGYMMFVDPYTNDYDRILYQTEIHDLCAETKLYFSAWFTDINRYVHLKAVRPKIELQMIDFDTEAVLASSGIMVLDSGNFWSRIGIPFTTGATSSSIIFRIYNKEQSKDGNDWAMDDIEIRLCANPVVTELAPEGVEICENQPFTLSGTYTDAGTFGKNLSYRWEYSTTGDINTLSDWDSVPGSSGTVTNGRVVSSYTIDSLTAGRAGFYRLAVSTAAQIEGSYCRAISEPVELKVKNSGISAIGGDSTVCEGNTITLTNAVTGGTWISSNPEIATVDIISGEVMGISAGSVEISYKVENNGCTGTTSTIIAVASSPNAGTISEVSSVCERSSVILTSSVAGGTWASVHPEVATVNEWGVLTGVSAGVAKIVYSVTQNGCTDTTSVNITVIAFPDAGEIEIPAAICVNDTVIASTSTPVQNTTWLSSNPEIAKIDAATGKLIGIQDGSVMISCILSNGICIDTLRTLLEVDFCLDCSEGGTVLYRQDFGGNSPSDPHTANEGFPKEHSELWYSKTTTHGAPHFRGYYNLTKDPEYVYPEGFYSINDHTHFGDPYRGYMMFIDPFTDDNGKILYQTEIHDLCAETKLYFSAWFTDLNKYVHAKAERP
ncbi:MAG: hypothetical protein FWD09_06720, partial [Lentimicrobiaceae bacterium]|nr:hypothetical protein [Lentimicrobiaceae bacterium]